MEIILEQTKEKVIRLDALSCNLPAQRLYKSLGFQYCGKRNLYASNVGWIDFYYFEKEL